VRTFAALPNWTGLWETDASAAMLSQLGGAHDELSSEEALRADFKRVVLLGNPPYNAEWQKKAAESQEKAAKARKSGRASAPRAVCSAGLWGGFPAVMDSVVPDDTFEAVVTPEETLFIFPDGEVRHIYTDGRPHPKPEDLWPTRMGDSIGRWQGATLVVDTIARKAGPIFPLFSADLSGRAHFTERIRRLDADTMENRMTIDDPLRFVRPWDLTIVYKRVTNLDRMIETNCSENDRNPLVNGQFVVAPP